MPIEEKEPDYIREIRAQGTPNVEAADAFIASLESQGQKNKQTPAQLKKAETIQILEKIKPTNIEPDNSNSQLNLTEARKRLPLLKDLDDESFVDTVHKLYYSDIKKDDFDKFIGYTRPTLGQRNEISEGVTNNRIEKTTEVIGSSIIWILLIGGFLGYLAAHRAGRGTLALINRSRDKSIGIQGWLRLFIVVLGIFVPALNFGSVASGFHDGETAYAILASTPAWVMYKNIVWLTLGCISAFSIYAAIQLRFIWKPSSVTLAKIAVLLWLFAGILIEIVIPAMVLTEHAITAVGKSIWGILTPIIFAAIWMTYLSMSKRVRATYLGGQGNVTSASSSITDTPSVSVTHKVPTPIKAEDASPVISSQAEHPDRASAIAPAIPQLDGGLPIASASVETEEAMYEKIGSELDSGKPHTPTWLKAFANANGDERIAKANYIKLRLEKLLIEEQRNLNQTAAIGT